MSVLQKQKTKNNLIESVPFGILLALVGGFLDAYTYITRGGVFANAQTGNIVLLGIRLVEGNFMAALQYTFPILAFILGVVVAEHIKLVTFHHRIVQWAYIILIIEVVLLAVIAFLPLSIPNAVVNITVAFVASIQVASFKRLMDSPYATTMTTGNLRSAVEFFYLAIAKKDRQALKKAVRFTWIILSFISGAVAGAFTSYFWQEKSVLVCVGLLLLAMGILIFYEKKKNHLSIPSAPTKQTVKK